MFNKDRARIVLLEAFKDTGELTPEQVLLLVVASETLLAKKNKPWWRRLLDW